MFKKKSKNNILNLIVLLVYNLHKTYPIMGKTMFIFYLLLSLSFGIVTEATAQGDAEMGRKLFTGVASFENGGVTCLSCHNVDNPAVPHGGLLAKDLTNVYTRMGGEAGLGGILGAPPFPAMSYSYKYNPLTELEIAHIVAFLKDADMSNPKSTQAMVDGGMKMMLGGGAVGLVVFFLLIHLIWGNRKKGHTKVDIFDRQLSSNR